MVTRSESGEDMELTIAVWDSSRSYINIQMYSSTVLLRGLKQQQINHQRYTSGIYVSFLKEFKMKPSKIHRFPVLMKFLTEDPLFVALAFPPRPVITAVNTALFPP